MDMECNSIYGIIKIREDYHESVSFLKTLGKDEKYPFINSNMFGYGDYEKPYYYDHMVISFAATYKYFGLDLKDWNDFIIKMEYILKNIDFSNAQFHVESPFGDFTLFWKLRRETPHLYGIENEEKWLQARKLVRNENFYFGFGKRSVSSGQLDKELASNEDLRNIDIGFIYPVPEK